MPPFRSTFALPRSLFSHTVTEHELTTNERVGVRITIDRFTRHSFRPPSAVAQTCVTQHDTRMQRRLAVAVVAHWTKSDIGAWLS